MCNALFSRLLRTASEEYRSSRPERLYVASLISPPPRGACVRAVQGKIADVLRLDGKHITENQLLKLGRRHLLHTDDPRRPM